MGQKTPEERSILKEKPFSPCMTAKNQGFKKSVVYFIFLFVR